MRVIFWVLFWLLSGAALAVGALPPLVPEGEKLNDFSDWRIDNRTSYTSIAYSPDGRFIVSDSDDNTARIWNAQSGQNLRILEGHSRSINSVAYSPDGRFIVSGSDDNTLRIWDAQSGKSLKILQGHKEGVNSVAYSPGGRFIASSSGDNTLRIWDVQSGESLKTLRGHKGVVNSVAYSPDGQSVVSGSDDNTVHIWNVQSGVSFKKLQSYSSAVNSVIYSPDGQFVVGGLDDNTVRVWDVQSGKSLRTLQEHSAPVYSVAYSPGGQFITSASEDSTVRIWDTQTGESLKTLQSHREVVNSVAYSPDGRFIISGSDDDTMIIWDAQSGKSLKTLQGYSDWSRSVSYSPDGKFIVSGSDENMAHIWDAQSGKARRTLRGHSQSVRSVTYSPDGQFIASGSDDNTIRIWNSQSGKSLKTLYGHTGWVWSVAYSPDGQFIASGSNDNTIRIWDVQSGEAMATLQGHNSNVLSVAYSPDGQFLVSGSSDSTVRIWDVKSGEILKTLRGHSNWVWSVAYSPDGQFIASGSFDNTVRVWDSRSGGILKKLAHSESVWSVAYSPDGQSIASGSYDNTVRIWDSKSGEHLKTLQVYNQKIWSIAYSPDGQFIASGGFPGIILWKKGLFALRLVGSLNSTWFRQDRQGNFWRFDDGSLLKVKQGNNWVPALPRAAALLSEQPLQIIPQNLPLELNNGELTKVALLVKNTSENLLYWIRPQLSVAMQSHFAMQSPKEIQTLKPGESYELELSVIPRLEKVIQPRESTLYIELAAPQLREPASIKIPVKVNAPKLQLAAAELLGDGKTLKVKVANKGTQAIGDTFFTLNVPGVDNLDSQSVSEPIPPMGFIERTFSLPSDFKLEKDTKIGLAVRNKTLPLMAWNFDNRSVKIHPQTLGWMYAWLALLGLLGVAGTYYYRLYRHPLVTQLSGNAPALNALNLTQLPKAKRLLTQTRRLSTILDKAEVSSESFNYALNFPNATPQQKAQQLARRLGATTETLNAEQGLFRLKLNPDFPLNTDRLLLYFPQVAAEDAITTLKTLPKTAGRITLIIGPDNSYQLKLLNTTSQLDNKYVAPRSSQLTEWLLSLNAETVLAKIMSEQLSLTQISPYQIGGGVDNESVFFGRHELIAQITNRDPANYLLVGGRQMGKSTLLKALQRRYTDNPTIQCHYLTLSNEVLIRRLAGELGLSRTDDPETLVAELEQLHKQAGKHLVLLIDEADRFIQHEQQNDYPILNVFRRLSEQGQCTFIFAGFWQLYRHAVLDYQSPLRNFGEVLEIGALESDACYDLATQPMATMNLSYASDTIVYDMVNACGQRANLIAFACHHLLQALEPKQRIIEAGDIQGILTDRKMSEKAVMGWSLGNNPLEERYEHLIIYSTIDRGSFSTGELIRELQEKGVEVDVPLLENCLSRLQLAYVLQRAGNRWQYCVPLFVDYVGSDDPDVKLDTVLRG